MRGVRIAVVVGLKALAVNHHGQRLLALGRHHDGLFYGIGRERGLPPGGSAGAGHAQRACHHHAGPRRLERCAVGAGHFGRQLVHAIFDVDGERHDHLHPVGRCPMAVGDGDVRAWLIVLLYVLAVEQHLEAAGGPVGHPELQRKVALAPVHPEHRPLGGPRAVLRERQLLVGPLKRRRHVKTHPQRAVVVEIGGLLVLGVVLRSRAATTGRLRCLVAEWLGGIQSDGILIGCLVLVRIERADDLVVQAAFIVVHVGGLVGVVGIEVLG